jgi:para-aminobenzoate synthetase component I
MLTSAESARSIVVGDDNHDPFAAVQRFCEQHQGQTIELFLGYPMAAHLAGSRRPQPAPPCRLPTAACRIRDDRPQAAAAGGFAVGRWQCTWSVQAHAAAVEEVRQAIARGDVYQVNLVAHWRAPFAGDPRAVVAALAPLDAAWSAAMHEPGWSIVSATPELFLRTRGERIETMPIKGTRPAGGSDRIADSPKDRAEHVMIVDLERNDLGRVCRPGSVRVSAFLEERPMAGVRHMASTVEGRLRKDVGLSELLRATFPGGSVTGAPKLAAIDEIARLEPVGRGAAMGALGVMRPNGDLELGLTIRTLAIADGSIHLWVGGGIVWDSDPLGEVEESLVKARPLASLLGSAIG